MGIIHLRKGKGPVDKQEKPETIAVEKEPKESIEERDEAELAYDRAIRQENPEILCEDIGRRKENVKFFKLNDGTMRAVVFDEPVHFYDESAGRYRAIDNTLVDSGEKLETRKGVFHAALSKDASRKVELTKGDKKIEWAFMSEAGAARSLSPTAVRALATDKTQKVSASPTGAAVYENVLPDVDIGYEMSAGKVKENIVVKAPQEEYKYSFRFKTEGLSLRTSEDGSCIELYSEASDATGARSETVEFRIPAPYMFDAAGGQSDEVYYEVTPLQGGEYVFTVAADKGWLSLPDRAFPVTIDPQIETIPKPRWLEYQVYRRHSSEGDRTKVLSDMIRSAQAGSYFYSTEIAVRKKSILIEPSRVTKATLVLKTDCFNTLDDLKKVGSPFPVTDKIYGVRIDITSSFCEGADDFVRVLSPETGENTQFYAQGEFGPSLELDYVLDENTQKPVHKIDLAGLMEGEVDLITGELTARLQDVGADNSLLGLNVSHVFKKSAQDFSCGKNVRLSVHEQLSGDLTNPSVTIYTDERGVKHRFKEEYYWLNSAGRREYVANKKDIAVDLNRKLTYNGKEVFVEYKTDTGLRLITPLEDFKNVDFLDQREQEIKSLEETVRSYKDYFYKFVKMDTENYKIVTFLEKEGYDFEYTQEAFNLFIKNENYLYLSKEEALNYKSVMIQRVPLQRQVDKIEESITSLDPEKDKEKIGELEREKWALLTQINLIDERKDYMEQIKPQLIRNAKAMFKEYKTKEAELAALRPQIPTSYLTDGRIVKAFNGRLLAVYDNYGNSAVLDYDGKGRVRRIAEGEAKEIVFDYNPDGLLSSVTDARGRVTRYGYTDGNLTEIRLPGNRSVRISYTGNEIAEVTSSDFLKTSLMYAAGQLISAEHYGTIPGVGPGTAWEGDYESSLYAETFSYLGETAVTRDETTRHYFFNARGDQSACYDVIDGRKQETEFCMRPYTPAGEIKSEYLIRAKRGAANYLEGTASRAGTTELDTITGSNLRAGIKNYVFSAFAAGYAEGSKTEVDTEYEFYREEGNKPRFALAAEVFYDWEMEEFAMSFEGERPDRQCAALPVSLRTDDKGDTQMPTEIRLKLYAPSGQIVFDTFCFAAAEWTYHKFDEIGNRVRSESSWNELDVKAPAEGGGRTFEKIFTDYAYDDDRRLIRERTVRKVATASYVKEKATVTNYSYNSYGSPVRIERYVEDEAADEGTFVEEILYDEKGRRVRTVSYNTLDSGSKFYSEIVLAESGQVIAEKNETGEEGTAFDCIEGTNIVRSERSGNRLISYGRDVDDRVTGITASTDAGEENSTVIQYDLGLLTRLRSGNHVVDYHYDGRRQLRAVGFDSMYYLRHDYEENVDVGGVKCDKVSTVLADTETFEIFKDHRGNLRRTTCGGYVQAEWEYDDDKILNRSVTDRVAGYKGVKTYDELNRMTEYAYNRLPESTMDLDNLAETYAYNSEGFLARKSYACGGFNQTYDYSYRNNYNGDLESVGYNSGYKFLPKKDLLGRVKERVVSHSNNEPMCGQYISYRKRGDHTTNMPSTIRYGENIGDSYVISDCLKYDYDGRGNITSVYENGDLSVRYTYDALDRLIREDNKRLDLTQIWDYDNYGNILSKRSCSFTLAPADSIAEEGVQTLLYFYDPESDRLTELDGQALAYDAVGNPTLYRGEILAWEKGRQLSRFGGHGFVYNGLGQRVQKNDKKYTYASDGRLLREYTADGNHNLQFIYDDSGIAGIQYNNAIYFFRKNAQGDITALLDNQGHTVVRYVYNAWGEHAVLNPDGTENTAPTFIGNLNPLRYRGYYYDVETGLYHCQTRYYDPEIGRFLNADDLSYLDPQTINGLNLYAYCLNNPMNYIDSNGTSPKVNGKIDLWTLIGKTGNVWYSGRYKPKRSYIMDMKTPFKHLGNNLLYMGELFLSAFDLQAVGWNGEALLFTDQGFTIASFGADLLDGRFHINSTDYLGLKIGSAKLDLFDFSIESGNMKFNLLDGKISAFTVGAYSQYLDAEVLIGSIGATVKWDNGALTLGYSFGWGIKITIRFW